MINNLGGIQEAIKSIYNKVPGELSSYTDKLQSFSSEVFKSLPAESPSTKIKGVRSVKELTGNPWREIVLSKEEGEAIVKEIFPERKRLGNLGEMMFGKIIDHRLEKMGFSESKSKRKEEIKLFYEVFIEEMRGRTKGSADLTEAERVAINLYTGGFYRLINYSLDGDETNRSRFQKKYRLDDSDMQKACETVAPVLVKALASSLNRLPSYKKGVVYRGDTVTEKELNELKNGKVMINEKFLSCSKKLGISEDFVSLNYDEYTKDNKKESYQPVIYVIDCQSGKNVREYSATPSESEILYPPGQKFQTLEVTKEGNVSFVYLKELED